MLEASMARGPADFSPKPIFKSPLKHFDFHLLLDLRCSTRLHQAIDRVNPDSVSALPKPLSRPQIDDDPVLEFFKQLQVCWFSLLSPILFFP
jgi:hypothetical protein